jgi:UDP-N-acetylmuramate--alanine ligase
MSSKDKIVYFLGIGGIGMSALARFYRSQGYQVYGYDLTSTPLTKQLEKEGMQINYDDSVESIPIEVKEAKDLKVIYTPAIPKDHRGFNYLQSKGIPLTKRAKVLGEITQHFKTIAIAGTHGKTTTTAITAHILKRSSIDSVSFVGGLMSGYESNILMDPDPEWIVVEADEFDRSFLQLNPELLGITSVDADHLDIYENEDSLVDSFRELAAKIETKSDLIVCDTVHTELNVPALKYGFSEKADFRLESKGYQNGLHRILVSGLSNDPLELEIPMPGNHNALNAVLAAILCFKAGCSTAVIQESIRSFQGVKRRFEYIVQSPELVFIDDYAHHPKEINALIDAVKQLYPGKKVSGIFQPHLFSRTRDFADEFAQSLSRLDALYLMEIYPAREKPIPGIDSKMLLDKITINEKSIVNKENLPVLISSTNHEILLTIGAGDIALMVPVVKQALT